MHCDGGVKDGITAIHCAKIFERTWFTDGTQRSAGAPEVNTGMQNRAFRGSVCKTRLLTSRGQGALPASLEALPPAPRPASPLPLPAALPPRRPRCRRAWWLRLPAATVPSERLQIEPELLLGLQLHPGEEPLGKKVESAGTVSVSWTPAASRVPMLATARL